MDEIFLDAEWAKTAMKQLDVAVSDWNSANPKSEKMRIVWGFRDADSAERELEEDEPFRRQHGLLNWKSLDFDLFVGRHVELDSIESEVSELEACGANLAYVRISIAFENFPKLPRSAQKLFNILADCGTNTLVVTREKSYGNDPDSDEIMLLGVDAHLKLESLTYRVLSQTLADLWWSHQCIYQRFVLGEGYDHWNSPEEFLGDDEME